MKLKYLILIVILAFGTGIKAQTRSELIDLGDEAYDRANYASAAFFYKKVVTGKAEGVNETVYPYALKGSNRDFEKEREHKRNAKGDTLPAYDSARVDTVDLIHDAEELIDINSVDGSEGTRKEEKLYVLHRLAESYRKDHNYISAEEWYAKAVLEPYDQFNMSKYWYGVILMNNEKYEDAKKSFIDFIGDVGEQEELSNARTWAKTKMSSCSFAIKYGQDKPGITVQKLDSMINSGRAEFGATYSGDEGSLIFASAREGSIKPEHDKNPEYTYFDLWKVEASGASWGEPIALKDPVNTEHHEGAPYVTRNQSHIYFTRWGEEGPAIFMSKNFNGQWMKPLKLDANVNMEGAKTMHPYFDEEAQILYFSSNRDGGIGGMDIWYAKLDRWGNADSAFNLGAGHNTPGDEITPFYFPEQKTLYYSSNGLKKNYGGQDVYKTVKDSSYGWLRPENIGRPINSARDDAYYIHSPELNSGFFSSDRESCADCPTGNCFKLYAYDTGPNKYFVDGISFNAETDEIIPHARLTVRNVHNDSIIATIETDDEGYWSLVLEAEMTYFIKCQKTRYFGDATSVSTEGLTGSHNFMRDFYLTPIPLSEIDIPGIEYDYDAATLRPRSKEILDDLVDFLQLNDNLVIEIRSHTDVRGSDVYNMKLSDRRAKSCVDYLIANGISKRRLNSKGYGESAPLVENAQSEVDHQKNRRTTFTVISEEFGF